MPALITLLACALFVRLGMWQWQRGSEREREWQRFAHGAEELQTPGAGPLSAVPTYQRVRLTGVLDGSRQFLLDNRAYRGRAGYEVLTPLARAGSLAILIDRGWVPFSGSRALLPQVPLPSGTAAVSLAGRLAPLPSAGLALGHAPPAGEWPKVTSFPSMAELSQALGQPLEPRIVLLDAGEPLGYARDWQPPGIPPLRHFAYAIQWWAFAVTALVIWALMARRRTRRVA